MFYAPIPWLQAALDQIETMIHFDSIIYDREFIFTISIACYTYKRTFHKNASL